MWMLILATLAVAFASGISTGSSLERGHWESAFKNQLNRLDARHARRARSRRASRQHRAAVSGLIPIGQPVGRPRGRKAISGRPAKAA